jgi:hypothetical protein
MMRKIFVGYVANAQVQLRNEQNDLRGFAGLSIAVVTEKTFLALKYRRHAEKRLEVAEARFPRHEKLGIIVAKAVAVVIRQLRHEQLVPNDQLIFAGAHASVVFVDYRWQRMI